MLKVANQQTNIKHILDTKKEYDRILRVLQSDLRIIFPITLEGRINSQKMPNNSVCVGCFPGLHICVHGYNTSFWRYLCTLCTLVLVSKV